MNQQTPTVPATEKAYLTPLNAQQKLLVSKKLVSAVEDYMQAYAKRMDWPFLVKWDTYTRASRDETMAFQSPHRLRLTPINASNNRETYTPTDEQISLLLHEMADALRTLHITPEHPLGSTKGALIGNGIRALRFYGVLVTPPEYAGSSDSEHRTYERRVVVNVTYVEPKAYESGRRLYPPNQDGFIMAMSAEIEYENEADEAEFFDMVESGDDEYGSLEQRDRYYVMATSTKPKKLSAYLAPAKGAEMSYVMRMLDDIEGDRKVVQYLPRWESATPNPFASQDAQPAAAMKGIRRQVNMSAIRSADDQAAGIHALLDAAQQHTRASRVQRKATTRSMLHIFEVRGYPNPGIRAEVVVEVNSAYIRLYCVLRFRDKEMEDAYLNRTLQMATSQTAKALERAATKEAARAKECAATTPEARALITHIESEVKMRTKNRVNWRDLPRSEGGFDFAIGGGPMSERPTQTDMKRLHDTVTDALTSVVGRSPHEKSVGGGMLSSSWAIRAPKQPGQVLLIDLTTDANPDDHAQHNLPIAVSLYVDKERPYHDLGAFDSERAAALSNLEKARMRQNAAPFVEKVAPEDMNIMLRMMDDLKTFSGGTIKTKLSSHPSAPRVTMIGALDPAGKGKHESIASAFDLLTQRLKQHIGQPYHDQTKGGIVTRYWKLNAASSPNLSIMFEADCDTIASSRTPYYFVAYVVKNSKVRSSFSITASASPTTPAQPTDTKDFTMTRSSKANIALVTAALAQAAAATSAATFNEDAERAVRIKASVDNFGDNMAEEFAAATERQVAACFGFNARETAAARQLAMTLNHSQWIRMTNPGRPIFKRFEALLEDADQVKLYKRNEMCAGGLVIRDTTVRGAKQWLPSIEALYNTLVQDKVAKRPLVRFGNKFICTHATLKVNIGTRRNGTPQDYQVVWVFEAIGNFLAVTLELFTEEMAKTRNQQVIAR